MEKRTVTFLMIAVVAVIMVISALLFNQTAIFQEGNPLPVVGGIWKLSVGGEPYAQIREQPVTYITRTGEFGELFTRIEANWQARYVGEKDGAYLFERDGKQLALTPRQYSRSYQIWEMPKE